MRKLCAGLFVICYFVLNAVVHGATIEIEGRALDCPKDSAGVFVCQKDAEKILVVDTGYGFSAVTKSGSKYPIVKLVDKVSDGTRVLFEASDYLRSKAPDSKAKRISDTKAVISSLKGVKHPLALELVADAKEYLKNNKGGEKELNLTIGNEKEAYQCRMGETRKLSQAETKLDELYGNVKCEYYSCQKPGSDEKVLAFLPTDNSFQGPSVLKMKEGQAQLVVGDFKATGKDGVTYLEEQKSTGDEELYDPRLLKADIDPSLMVPSKYEASKSSFNYLTNLNENNFTADAEGLCSSNDIKDLFSLQKKIGKEMRDHLSEAELVEYLKMVDGSISSYYVDKKKGQSLGCLYQGKIVDNSVIQNFDHLKDISIPKPVTKYLTEEEVQKLFTDAKNMKDIPFGYKYDGCYARAHIMSRRFEQMGIAAQKVWIKGDLKVPGTDIEWNYHVAPVVEVKKKDGTIEKYVIDPSLTEKAVTVDQWVAKMDRGYKGPIMKTTYPFPLNGGSFDRTVVAISSSEPFAPMDMPITEEQKMGHATQVLKEFSEVLASRGK
ncbi:hypothetical protein DOM21_05915 [Bacteriovorax stolpii]|uniref:Uncharacterized protein n=1 Tax=Bacteriovorax stolpii TaxID=960 RepID=A0A2K9NU38_BACTC|nr:protein-glutamine glutaminase family protein [Bacteriovorax stolpii]AUN99007.1 hypothetical protein C0V70_13025 [Bacteriovorax stolpii]QDK40997.1 hypothetical protein DOM21_05915 [Bacteriovorax stolpii]TDP55468.1 hypothetical protein C8D79_0518 [Bacteriovorax stolpii]